MRTNVTTTKTPHGAIPFAQIRDPQTRDAIMKLNENILAIDRRLARVERAALELQKRRT